MDSGEKENKKTKTLTFIQLSNFLITPEKKQKSTKYNFK